MTPIVKKRGRPPIAAERRKSVGLLSHFTPGEAEHLISLAREKRRSISELIRFACRKMLLDRRGAHFRKS